MRFENGGFPDSRVLIDTFEEPPSLGLNVDEEATIRKLKQRIKNGIFKEVTMDNTDCKKFVDLTEIDIKKQVKFVEVGDGSWASKYGSTVSAGGYSAFFENKSCWDVFDILREKGIIKNMRVDYPAIVKFIKNCSVYYEDVIENEIGLFRVGDEVITSDGRKGKIVDICRCEECERRGFYEPKVLYDEYDEAEYITNGDKERNFCDFYKIGNTVFGNADISKIDYDISEYKRLVAVWTKRRKNLLEAMNNGKE